MPAAAQDGAPERLDRDRFTFVCFPEDLPLARAMLADAMARDTFPGLPRPRQRVLIAIAPDQRRFREWIGPAAPEWGAAIAFPDSRRIVMQGRRAGSDAGNPLQVLRHELAHLALHEWMGDLPPRWFDEGYASVAAGEWGREESLQASLALVLRPPPSLDSLDAAFQGGASQAGTAYALAYRAVAELSTLDPERGLTLFFRYWQETGSLERAVRAAYGMPLARFEEHWQSQTRRRYGGLALAADFGIAGGAMAMLLVPLYIARRRRDRRRMAMLRATDEAAERAARTSALDALLGPEPEAAPPEPRAPDRAP